MNEQVRAVAQGRVQGVFYRASAQRRAYELGLTGWVRNTPEGDVEMVVEGEHDMLELFLTWARIGPPNAMVETLSLERGPATGQHTAFSVRH